MDFSKGDANDAHIREENLNKLFFTSVSVFLRVLTYTLYQYY